MLRKAFSLSLIMSGKGSETSGINYSVNVSLFEITHGNALRNWSDFDLYELHVPKRDSLSCVVPMTALYVIIFVSGLVGNFCTCVVIIRNRHMRTSTNCYLFSLAVSDLLLLLVGMPQEVYQLWNRYPYMFGEMFCIIRGLASETSTNVSILTITSFTVERYLAICHPLKAQATSRIGRAIKIILGIWLIGGVCAAPLACQFGIVLRQYRDKPLQGTDECTLKRRLPEAFEISTFFFFLLPMVIISVLYIFIGLRLRQRDGTLQEVLPIDRPQDAVVSQSVGKRLINRLSNRSIVSKGGNSSREAAVKMLFAVVVAFFACWAPFHAQRLLALHSGPEPTEAEIVTYTILTYISGVTYFVSATINPILYSIMSMKFRRAFRETLAAGCCKKPPHRLRARVLASSHYECHDVKNKLFGLIEKRKMKNLKDVSQI